MRALRVFHMRAGDVERSRPDFMIGAVDERPSVSLGNIMDLVAAVPMRMAGNGALESFIDQVQGMKTSIRNGKINIDL